MSANNFSIIIKTLPLSHLLIHVRQVSMKCADARVLSLHLPLLFPNRGYELQPAFFKEFLPEDPAFEPAAVSVAS